MRFLKYISALVPLFLIPNANAFAADQNGYTAQYECRAGGPNCNVDVAGLGTRACDQVINTSTPWSAINWGNSTICLEAGDHVWKGTLTIPASANGTAGNYKVLRYLRTNDTDDEPWDQSDANKAKVKGLYVNGHYWLVQRLTFPGTFDGPTPRLASDNGSTNHIFNRILVEGVTQAGTSYYGYSQACGFSGYDRLTVQNSVFRNLGPAGSGIESIAIDLQCGSNMRAVNNEVYNWVAHAVQVGHNFPNPTLPGLVVENNDFYVTPDLYTNGGAMAKTEGPLSIKFHGTPASPGRIIQNRLWGARRTDLAFCCNGESGQLITNYEVLSYVLFQNNILFDAQTGLGNIANHQSVVGNIFWDIKRHTTLEGSFAINKWRFNDAPDQRNWEIYLNTFIGVDGEWSVNGLDSEDGDTKCNIFIASAPKYPASTPSSSQADFNAFYGSPPFAFNGTNTNVNVSFHTRANNATYDSGAVIRLTDTPPRDGTAGDFLYTVVTAGESAQSTPAYCTTLGCTTQDGTMVVKAIRGPHTFYRKLKTGPEKMSIPYAKVHTSAPEAYRCPSNYSARRGIGINDQ